MGDWEPYIGITSSSRPAQKTWSGDGKLRTYSVKDSGIYRAWTLQGGNHRAELSYRSSEWLLEPMPSLPVQPEISRSPHRTPHTPSRRKQHFQWKAKGSHHVVCQTYSFLKSMDWENWVSGGKPDLPTFSCILLLPLSSFSFSLKVLAAFSPPFFFFFIPLRLSSPSLSYQTASWPTAASTSSHSLRTGRGMGHLLHRAPY